MVPIIKHQPEFTQFGTSRPQVFVHVESHEIRDPDNSSTTDHSHTFLERNISRNRVKHVLENNVDTSVTSSLETVNATLEELLDVRK